MLEQLLDRGGAVAVTAHTTWRLQSKLLLECKARQFVLAERSILAGSVRPLVQPSDLLACLR